jgi:small subunit ribosomal protein S14
MAKKSMIARDVKRAKLAEKYAAKRAELKARIKAGDVEAVAELNKLPKNASPVRKRNRCQIDGRPRGYMREFGISRIKFRQLAGAGLIPGVTKSSW